MLLSELVYQSVKNVEYRDDISFTYNAFKTTDFSVNEDYALYILNVFTPINEAIARLNDLERIPYKLEGVEIKEHKISLPKDCKMIMNVGIIYSNGETATFPYARLGRDKILVKGIYNSKNAFVEYKEDIKPFSAIDFCYTNGIEKDIDLLDYGIDNGMCQYIIEYVQGKLYEPTDVDVANMHLTRAESYFSNIPPVESAFAQQTMVKTFSVGE